MLGKQLKVFAGAKSLNPPSPLHKGGVIFLPLCEGGWGDFKHPKN